MAIDYREKEREFLDGLEEATGRGLDAWMALISEMNFTERNDLIDWLRQQGFMFSKASWLERVHHNGGKPIYSDAAPPRAARSKAKAGSAGIAEPTNEQIATPVSPAVIPTQSAPPMPEFDDVQAVLASAKGLRPLATVIMRLVKDAVPSATIVPSHQHLSFEIDGRAFAVLIVGAKDLRLGLASSPAPSGSWQSAKFQNPALRISSTISHMLVLSDVRQLTPDLRLHIAAAASARAA